MDQKLTLSELNGLIKDALFEAFPATVWVVAEISELKENRSGHCYLELIEKEENEIIARSRATIWSYTFRMLKPYFETTTGQLFTQGIKILVQVSVEYHPSFGLSLNIKDIDPVYTVGDLALQRKEIITRLQNEGVFGMNKELQLPMVPQNIAVISSKTAAGYQDFIHQLETNENGFKFYTHLFEANMQGSEAASSIITALEHIFEYEDFFDAVVIIRGGGATADLSCFDNYDLALNITQFPLPVITGIGHEKDDTIIDMVAHTRLKTPTAVAEFFITGVEQFYEQILNLENEIVNRIRETVEIQQEKLEQFATVVDASVSSFIQEKNIQLNRVGNALFQKVNRYSINKNVAIMNLKYELQSKVLVWDVETKNSIDRKRRILKRVVREILLKEEAGLNHFKEELINGTRTELLKKKEQIHLNENAIRLLSPENVLRRGYTLTMKEGKIIKSVRELEPDDELDTRFADGSIKSKIIKKQDNGS
jgi:exodeoxyribonuclease VII large subunit